jgi:FlgD Ig-like domain
VNDNNGNGLLDPGENAGLNTWLKNAGNLTATNVRGTLRTTCPYITITDSLYNYGNIATSDSANNTADPYDLLVQSTCPEGTVANFTLYLVSAESTWIHTFTKTVGLAAGTIIWGPKPLPNFPSTGFIYGLAYNRSADRLCVLDAYGRTSYVCSSDSFATYIGTVAAPDTNCDDASFSRYDGRLWVTSFYLKQIWKIDPSTGVILRQFANPANDYPVGLAWNGQRLWLADRRTTLGGIQLLYYSDTMGTATQYLSPIQGYYNSRCLAYDSLGNTLVQAQTWFNSGGTAVDSCGAVEFTNSTPPAFTGRKFLLNTGWNIRGIEFDPRDGNFWVTIPQGGAALNQIVKVKGFRSPAIGIAEQKSAARTPVTLTAYPNPFRTAISFSIGQSAKSKELSIYDISGRLLRSYTLGALPSALVWNGTDQSGNQLPAGVYFVKLAADNGETIQKVILTR